MSAFILIAAIMAAIAASAVALPLLRNRPSRLQGAVAGVLMIGLAAGLYPLWSNWNWHAPKAPEPSPDVLAMVSKLEQRMRTQPDDAAGWLMLGRSYLALERFDDAILAYERAQRLDPDNLEAIVSLGEAMSLRAGGEITPPAAQLFERAVRLAPHSPQALLYGGFAAAVRGDNALARSRWLELKGLHPPPQIESLIDARLAELPPSGIAPAPAGGAAGQGSAGAASEALVNLSIAPQLKSRLIGNPPVFVFAREPGGAGPPLAAKRLTREAIGTQIKLTSSDSMVPGRALAPGQRVSITARVSFSGQPLPAAGDLYGELTYEVGRDGARDLIIDRVAQ